jgi:(4-(4-[2-(gamma-L-glutamylamino)ethyl]phenoxymethyl)furan-2-yl)methanamine synthase
LAKVAIAAQAVLRRLPSPPDTVVISGQGEFFARRLLDRMKLAAAVVSLRDKLGAALSQAAPAHALAVLAREGSE